MKVKGNIIKARIAFVIQHFGEEGWEKVLSSLPPEDQKTLKGLISPMSWFDFAFGERLDKAIVEVLGDGDPQVFEALGVQSAKENLTGVHRDFLESNNPMAFMEKAPMIYKFYYDTGYRTWEAKGEQEGFLTTYEAETYSAVDCLTVIGWYKEALKMCGAKEVWIEEIACRAKGDAYCRYHIRWRGP